MASRFAILRRAPSRNHDRAGSSRHTASLAECIDWRSRILKRIEAGDYIEALIRIRQRLHFANAEVSSGQAFVRDFYERGRRIDARNVGSFSGKDCGG